MGKYQFSALHLKFPPYFQAVQLGHRLPIAGSKKFRILARGEKYGAASGTATG